MIPENIQSKASAEVMFGEEARQKRKTFTNQSKISDKAIGLKFVAPTIVGGVPTARLENNEVEKMNEIWMNVVIGYVVSHNPALTNFSESTYVSMTANRRTSNV